MFVTFASYAPSFSVRVDPARSNNEPVWGRTRQNEMDSSRLVFSQIAEVKLFEQYLGHHAFVFMVQ
jgi:hypothetical protein